MRIRRLQAMLGVGALLAGGVVLLTVSSAAAANVITVNTGGDAAGACPGTCTLRAAFAAATTGNDVIQFSAAVNGTIVLDHTKGSLGFNEPSGSLTVQGNGTANTIINGFDGTAAVRVIDQTGAGGTLSLQNLTIENGATTGVSGSGAGVRANTVTTNNVNFSGNSAGGGNGSGGAISASNLSITGGVFDSNSAAQAGGAIDALSNGTISGNAKFTRNHATGNRGGAVIYDGTLTVTDSTFGGVPASQGNSANAGGGAIATISGTSLTVTRTIIINNTSDVGGGIYVASNGTVTVSNSAILSNVAQSAEGGGIFLDGPGGNASQILTVDRSVLQANASTTSAGGAIQLTVASGTGAVTATITNSTFQTNTAATTGGAVNLTNPNQGTATVTLLNDTIAQNTATSGAGVNEDTGAFTLTATILSANSGPNCSGTFIDGGSNLVFGGSGGSTCPTGGTNIAGQDPLLGPLQVNPPGFTATMALLPGSPAIDRVAGGCPPPTTDQRGVSRPQGAACDIGAFEVQVPTAPTAAVTLVPRFTG